MRRDWSNVPSFNTSASGMLLTGAGGWTPRHHGTHNTVLTSLAWSGPDPGLQSALDSFILGAFTHSPSRRCLPHLWLRTHLHMGWEKISGRRGKRHQKLRVLSSPSSPGSDGRRLVLSRRSAFVWLSPLTHIREMSHHAPETEVTSI